MKFRTEIEIKSSPRSIDYGSRILMLGSCFAQNVAQRLARLKFDVVSNPTGVLFNPLSIAQSLERYAAGRTVRVEELVECGGVWSHLDFHSSFSSVEPQQTVANIECGIDVAAKALAAADTVVLTLGTAYVYSLVGQGRVVASCHKLPSSCFERRLLSVEQVEESLRRVIEGELSGKRVILTVSPIRHLADGMAANSLSKATLRVAAERLCEGTTDVEYFPSYEILVDDLRDYRFYESDMVHPSAAAVDYIWECFAGCYMTPQTARQMSVVEHIISAVEHRPLHPQSAAYAHFAAQQLRAVESVDWADMSAERQFFENIVSQERQRE